MTRIFDIREPSTEALRDAPVYFRYGANKRRVLIDKLTADAILAVRDALSEPSNVAKIDRMIAGTQGQFMKIADFAFKHVKIA